MFHPDTFTTFEQNYNLFVSHCSWGWKKTTINNPIVFQRKCGTDCDWLLSNAMQTVNHKAHFNWGEYLHKSQEDSSEIEVIFISHYCCRILVILMAYWLLLLQRSHIIQRFAFPVFSYNRFTQFTELSGVKKVHRTTFLFAKKKKKAFLEINLKWCHMIPHRYPSQLTARC